MRYLIVLFCCLLGLVGCTQSQENQATMIENITPTQQVPLDKQYHYGLDVALFHQNNEIYINDILIQHGRANPGIELNQWLLGNGTYTIKLKMYPELADGDTLMDLAPKEHSLPKRFHFVGYRKDSAGRTGDVTILKEFKFNFPQEPVPYFEQEWTINVDSLPYQLEGWSNGEDLSKYKEEKLEKEVVRFYEKVRKVMDDGDVDTYSKLFQIRRKEINTILYKYDERKIRGKFEENSREIREKTEGNMLPIEDYTMKVYGKKHQLVTLERNATTELNGYQYNIKGWSPLIRKNKISGGAHYAVLLYRPRGSKDFVIIR